MTHDQNGRNARSYSRENYKARSSRSVAKSRRNNADGINYRDRGKSKHSNSRGGAGSRSKSKSLSIPLAPVIVVIVVVAIGIFAFTGLKGCESNPLFSGADTVMTELSNPPSDESMYLPTPIMAESEGIQLHSAVRMDQLTEILIHNASYNYACEITTKLKEATNTEVIEAHGTGRVASTQPTGDKWMTGEFIRCFRSGSAGPKMSAIDCGGPVGATVYAPVSGTVVKVKKYNLYDNADYPDIQIHIQPEGRSDLDVVLIHLTDATVSEGDTVEGGVTPIASIRDVYAYIGDSMQLRDYTAKGDNGNHTHVCVNNANAKNYHGLD